MREAARKYQIELPDKQLACAQFRLRKGNDIIRDGSRSEFRDD